MRMDLSLNNRRVFTYIQPSLSPLGTERDNNTHSWGINALVRYWHHPNPTMFRYNKHQEKPLTEEEKKQWGI